MVLQLSCSLNVTSFHPVPVAQLSFPASLEAGCACELSSCKQTVNRKQHLIRVLLQELLPLVRMRLASLEAMDRKRQSHKLKGTWVPESWIREEPLLIRNVVYTYIKYIRLYLKHYIWRLLLTETSVCLSIDGTHCFISSTIIRIIHFSFSFLYK